MDVAGAPPAAGLKRAAHRSARDKPSKKGKVGPVCYCSARQIVASPHSYSRANSAIVSPAA